MNIRNINILSTFAALLLCVVVGSCSRGELDIEQGRTLPPGMYPLMFTATVDGMMSRADVETEPWVDGDSIATQIKGYSLIGYYVLNTDGSVKESDDPLAWPIDNGTVKAWYPSKKLPFSKKISDQSKGYHDIDFLYAESQGEYNKTIDLRFRHQMAKVRCNLIKGDGVTEEDLKTAKVSFYGFTKAKFSETGVSGEEGNVWITPTSSDFEVTKTFDYEALLVPQNMSEKPFIKVNLEVHVNGISIDKELIYTPEAGKGQLEAGNFYTYNIEVQKDRLVAQSVTGQWNDEKGAEYADGVPRRVNLNIPGGKGPTLSFSENVTQGYNDTRAGGFPDYLIVKGREFTISYDIDEENAMMGILPLIDDADKVKMNCLRIDEVYIFTYKLLSDDTVSLEYTEYARVGDFYYSDGTWSRGLIEGKTPIGVVFRSGAAGTASENNHYGVDIPKNYGWDRPIRGYVVALNDASTSKGFWGGIGGNKPPYYIIDYDKDKAENTPENTRYSGYLNTQAIRTDEKKLGTNDMFNNTDVNKHKQTKGYFWAFKVAVEYRPSNLTDDKVPSAPSTSSGWYLPSIRQLNDIAECFQVKYCILEAKGTAFDALGVEYWSSSEYIYNETQATTAHTMNIATRNKFSRNKVSYTDYVRSVLTF